MSSAEEKFPITAAQLAGNFCETLVYGMYLVTCCFCARTLLVTSSGPREGRLLRLREIRWMMAIIALALFCICTFDVAIGLLHNFNAFIRAPNAKEEFLNIKDWINLARSVNQLVAMLLGDFVLIYRCWIVYGRRWLVIVPSVILYLGGIAMAAKLMHVEADPDTEQDISLNSPQIRPWWLSFFAITAFQNSLTTSVLIYRIWRVDSQSSKYLSHDGSIVSPFRPLPKVIRVVAESGAAYTLLVIITFIVSVSQNHALYPMSDMTLQATGVAFNVILIRASARRDRQFTAFDQSERGQTVAGDERTAGSTTIGSMNLSHHRHGHRLSGATPIDEEMDDVEMGVKSIRSPMDKPSETEIYPGGITVTKVVHTS
ncbi:hypothetical protein AGABI2DRAFT_179566 [Agaricus bisporus var. bisporus H97]|uniref:hypothetical protein n=1 Tax=Agaricus bisporus var. bisporus (strain H97 / ATCC MYA-4626 / FGSC 10389) TaxID=936046 RepID=UPI00029F6BD3|nr:hypothetical protein AGABI2DRAFT_179566 [Agaricus bisporus var. bisporus H97]EKV44874.1 hypothetical protein AGABI2DRAFT_179566 [Agaricus bisporus var. bisporus H97]